MSEEIGPPGPVPEETRREYAPYNRDYLLYRIAELEADLEAA